MSEIDQHQRISKKQYLVNQKNFRIAGVIALSVLATGTVFFHFVEGLKWLDAFYFSTITLTTVGYGDITPHTDVGKIFTIFYVLIGIGIIATFANLFLKNAISRREIKRTDRNKD